MIRSRATRIGSRYDTFRKPITTHTRISAAAVSSIRSARPPIFAPIAIENTQAEISTAAVVHNVQAAVAWGCSGLRTCAGSGVQFTLTFSMETSFVKGEPEGISPGD